MTDKELENKIIAIVIKEKTTSFFLREHFKPKYHRPIIDAVGRLITNGVLAVGPGSYLYIVDTTAKP